MHLNRLLPWSAELLRKGMDYTSARHRCIEHNIANVDTPGYQRKDVEFSNLLDQQRMAMKSVSLNPRHMPLSGSSSRFKVQTDDRPPMRVDGSNVDVDEEMTLLAMNAGKYLSYIELHERQMRMLRMAISERVT